MPTTLAEAVRRLGPTSRSDAAPVVLVMAGYLRDGEQVRHLVQGRVRNLVCVVARTDERLLVVVDRPGRPLVESLDPSTVEVRLAPTAGDPHAVDVVVVDGGRQLAVCGVRDLVEADGLVAAGRPAAASWF